MSSALSYCADQVRGHAREQFWLAQFIAPAAREGALALYALDVELSHLRRMVSEEMIGHIRYAWWREALEGMFSGRTIPGHPVLEQLHALAASGAVTLPSLLALENAYAATFPEGPQGNKEALTALITEYLTHKAPQSLPGWLAANKAASSHKAGRLSLLIKLLLIGLRPR